MGEGPGLSDAQMQELKEYYGFDKPAIIAYFNWLGKLVQGDLGTLDPVPGFCLGSDQEPFSHFAFLWSDDHGYHVHRLYPLRDG